MAVPKVCCVNERGSDHLSRGGDRLMVGGNAQRSGRANSGTMRGRVKESELKKKGLLSRLVHEQVWVCPTLAGPECTGDMR